MKQYIITEEQRTLIMNNLGEVPAKLSFRPLLILNQLIEATPSRKIKSPQPALQDA